MSPPPRTVIRFRAAFHFSLLGIRATYPCIDGAPMLGAGRMGDVRLSFLVGSVWVLAWCGAVQCVVVLGGV